MIIVDGTTPAEVVASMELALQEIKLMETIRLTDRAIVSLRIYLEGRYSESVLS